MHLEHAWYQWNVFNFSRSHSSQISVFSDTVLRVKVFWKLQILEDGSQPNARLLKFDCKISKLQNHCTASSSNELQLLTHDHSQAAHSLLLQKLTKIKDIYIAFFCQKSLHLHTEPKTIIKLSLTLNTRSVWYVQLLSPLQIQTEVSSHAMCSQASHVTVHSLHY